MSNFEKSSIKSWAVDDRPREKFLIKGKASLSDAELIAILIGSGNKEDSAVSLSKKILNSSNNNLSELSKLSVADLMKFKGIGEAKAITITAALELGRRRREAEVGKRKQIKSSKDVFEFMQSSLSDLAHEEFWIILLNRANGILKKQLISRGGISATVVDSKLIYKVAIENNASGIVICHNHPSGNITPSEEDKKLTWKLSEAAKIFDINFIDHVIFGDEAYFSFKDNNEI